MNIYITILTLNTIDIVADTTESILTKLSLPETIRQEHCTRIYHDISIPYMPVSKEAILLLIHPHGSVKGTPLQIY